MRVSSLAAVALTAALLAGCASTEVAPDLQEQELYQEAQSSLDAGRYTRAVEQLEALDTRFPFGNYAEQAQLELIYAYYQVDNWSTVWTALSIHLLFAVPTPLIWAMVIIRALKQFPNPPEPAAHGASHRRWGYLAVA